MRRGELEEPFGVEWRRGEVKEQFNLEDGDTNDGKGQDRHPQGGIPWEVTIGTRGLGAWGVCQKEVRICGLLDVIDLSKRLIFIFRPDLVVPTVGWNDRWEKDTSRGDDT